MNRQTWQGKASLAPDAQAAKRLLGLAAKLSQHRLSPALPARLCVAARPDDEAYEVVARVLLLGRLGVGVRVEVALTTARRPLA